MTTTTFLQHRHVLRSMLCSALLLGATAALAIAQPRISVVGGDTIRFGHTGGEILRRDVKIANIGTDTLRISEVRPTCGCTSAPIDETVIRPGDTTTVHVGMDVRIRQGEVAKAVGLFSNDPIEPLIGLQLRAFVSQDIVADSQHFPYVDATAISEQYLTEINLKNVGGSTVTVFKPESIDDDSIRIDFELTGKVPVAPGQSLGISAVIRPKIPGTYVRPVTIRSDGMYTPRLQLSVFCRLSGPKTAKK